MTRSFQLAALVAIIAVSSAVPALAQRSVDDAIKMIDAVRGDATTQAAMPVSFVPPPRTIKDITAILDQQKPDPAQAAVAQAAADAEPPNGLSKDNLADFYFRRGTAAGRIGRLIQRRDDMREAVRISHEVEGNLFHSNLLLRFAQAQGAAELEAGNFKEALAAQQERLHASSNLAFPTAFSMIEIGLTYARLGDLEEAKRWLSRSELQSQKNTLHPAFSDMRTGRLSVARAFVLEAEGNFGAAEGLYRQVVESWEKKLIPNEAALIAQSFSAVQPGSYAVERIRFVQALARTLLRQGRLVEAEAEARRALLEMLTLRGHYASETAGSVLTLTTIIYEQGRYAEAEQLAEAARDIYAGVGHGKGSYSLADARRWVAQTQTAQGKIVEARAVYAALEQDIGDDTGLRRSYLDTNLNYALVLLRSGQAEEVVRIIENVVAQNRKNLGDKAFVTAQTRGWLAVALAQMGQGARALAEFEAAVPILLAASRDSRQRRRWRVGRPARPADPDDRRSLSGLAGRYAGLRGGGRDLPPGRRDPRPVGAAGAGGLERARRGVGPDARQPRAPRAGRAEAGRRAARHLDQHPEPAHQ
ncbi:MAG: tetratricopeptide repeat protein [Pseudomonadota bacterium]